jgi:hypothetical protein
VTVFTEMSVGDVGQPLAEPSPVGYPELLLTIAPLDATGTKRQGLPPGRPCRKRHRGRGQSIVCGFRWSTSLPPGFCTWARKTTNPLAESGLWTPSDA